MSPFPSTRSSPETRSSTRHGAGRPVSRWRLAGKLTALLAVALLPLACGDTRIHPNPSASTFGHRHDELFMLITALTGVSFLIVLAMMAVPIIRDRARPGKKAHYDHGSSLHDKRFTAIVSVVVFIVLDAWVLFVSVTDLREAWWNYPPADSEEAYRVEVLAQQWAWNFRTPGIDGEFGTADDVVTINQLTVPADRPIVLNAASKDVIHSFFVPDMRIKRDANPGSVNRVWFQTKPEAAGNDYQILCAELCGFAHYQMYANLTVLSQDDFADWEQDASALAVASFDADDTEAHWAWDFKE